MTDTIFNDPFHWCALAAGFIAVLEDRLHDSLYVKQLTYEFYDQGAFRERVKPQRVLETRES